MATTTPDPLLQAVFDEYEEKLRAKKRARLASQTTELSASSAGLSPLEELPSVWGVMEVLSSKYYPMMDHRYEPPHFPAASTSPWLLEHLLNGPEQQTLLQFVYYKGKIIPTDDFDGHAEYLLAIIAYIRERALLPLRLTDERATSRILQALGTDHRFRQRMRDLMAATRWPVEELFRDVASFICYDHVPRPKRLRTRWSRLEDHSSETDAASHSPLASTSSGAQTTVARDTSEHPPLNDVGPPPYKHRLHRCILEERDRPEWGSVLVIAARTCSRIRDAPDALASRAAVVHAIVGYMQKQGCAAAPYFEDLPAEKLQDVLERDAAFSEDVRKLIAIACDLEGPLDDFPLVLRRIMNHLCQPRRSSKNPVRQVRFAAV